MSPVSGAGVFSASPPNPALAGWAKSTAAASDQMGASMAQANSALQTLKVSQLDTYQGALALGQSASSLGSTLQAANQLQDEAQKLWGSTATGKAILDNPLLQQERVVSQAVLPATNLAGSLADLAQAQAQAGSDLARLNAMLASPGASWAMRLQASAQATQSAAAFVQQQQAFVNSLDSTDRAYLEQSPAYRTLMQPVQPAFKILGTINASVLGPVATAASVAGAGAGIIVGGMALPGLVSGTIAAGKKFGKLLDDPKATQGQKLEGLANTTRGAAGVIYAASGIDSGIATLGQVASSVKALAPAVEAVAANPVVHDVGTILGDAFKVLLPIADAGTMVADGVTFKDKIEDPKASFGDKAKAFLAVSLDTAKVATYFFPATEGVRMAYLVASLGQMGFAMGDLSKTLIPEAVQTAGHLLDDAAHPVQSFHAVESDASKAASWLGQEFKGLVQGVGRALGNPGAAVQSTSVHVSGFASAVSQTWSGFKRVVSESAQLIKSAAGGSAAGTAISAPRRSAMNSFVPASVVPTAPAIAPVAGGASPGRPRSTNRAAAILQAALSS